MYSRNVSGYIDLKIKFKISSKLFFLEIKNNEFTKCIIKDLNFKFYLTKTRIIVNYLVIQNSLKSFNLILKNFI